jgi:hypothetical protein
MARLTYQPAVFFGKARLLYSVVFLFGIFAFYDIQAIQTVILICFWGIFLALWPLGLPEFLSGLRLSRSPEMAVGSIVRVDSPNLVRVELQKTDANWSQASPHVYQDSADINRNVQGDEQFPLNFFVAAWAGRGQRNKAERPTDTS